MDVFIQPVADCNLSSRGGGGGGGGFWGLESVTVARAFSGQDSPQHKTFCIKILLNDSSVTLPNCPLRFLRGH
jgi:hypothetical protein